MDLPPSGVWPRHIEAVVRDRLTWSRVVVLTGPRQAGKTTLAKALAAQRSGTYVSLDEEKEQELAREDLRGFLDRKPPLVIDEFQRGGDRLIRAIKILADEDPRPGRFVLTGSTNFLTIPTISESLAGRVALVEMGPLTQGELRGVRDGFIDRLFAGRKALLALVPEPLARREYFHILAAGGFPGALRAPANRRGQALTDLARTATERDIPDFSAAHGLARVRPLLTALAARTAQELNVSAVASELRVGHHTADAYIDLLEIVYLVTRLPAWTRHPRGRLVRHPKVHLVDTGLASTLVRASAEVLEEPGHPMSGPLVETFVAGEIRRQLAWSEMGPDLYHFRHHDGGEVDLVLESGDGRVAGVEVKAAASFASSDFRGLRDLADIAGKKFAGGVLLHLGTEAMPFGEGLCALPVSALWAP